MNAAAIGALAALAVGLLGLIGVPLSAQVTGMVNARSARLNHRTKHESRALGTLLRAWVVMDQTRSAGIDAPVYQGAYGDWLLALAEIAAYGSSEVSAAFANFVRNGADTSDAIGQTLLVAAIFAVRSGAFRRRLPVSDKRSIAILLFGAQS